MSTVIDPVDSYAVQFAQLTSEAKGRTPEWLTSLRKRAFESFQSRGFPTTRDEEWRFTSVQPIVQTEFATDGERRGRVDGRLVDACFFPIAATQLVFLNGRYAPDLSRTGSLPAGVRVESLASAVTSRWNELERYFGRVAGFDRQPFVALNTALWSDGAVVSVAAGAVIEAPIHFVFVSAPVRLKPDTTTAKNFNDGIPTVAYPRVLVMAGPGSQSSIIETYVGAAHDRYFTNTVTEVALDEQAIVNHYKVQRESESSYHIATVHATIGASAGFHGHSIGFGGALVRNDIVVTMAGEGGDCSLNGLYVADEARFVDNHTTIDHAKPHCGSREVYKGILAGRSRAVFNGKIIVRPDAQKTDAKQTNKALLLSADAQINTKPQLEIFANDVKCTHGAAVGQMDEDALFYLRARGLPLEEARNLLIHAFAGDVLDKMPLESLRTRMEAELLRRLADAGPVSSVRPADRDELR